MTRSLIFLLLVLTNFSYHAFAKPSAEGVVFFKGSWTEALIEAKKQQKLIFVDVYTDWCPPCKRMDAETFPNKEVGAFYNENFINFKLDAEKGEGIELAKRYAVKGYPAWLFVDEAGSLMLRGGDYMVADRFIDLGSKAVAQKNVAGGLTALEQRFSKGERGLVFLKEYLQKRSSLRLDNTEILDVYLKLLPESKLKNADEILFLGNNLGSKNSSAVPVIFANLGVLTKDQRTALSGRLYQSLLRYEYELAFKEERMDDAGEIVNKINQLVPYLTEKQLNSVNNVKLHYYGERKDAAGLKEMCPAIASKLMQVSDSEIAQKNAEIYQEVMEPFLSGKQDSTKIPNFSQEIKMMEKQHSAEISSGLYSLSIAYLKALAAKDKALNDAWEWASKAHTLYPNKATEKLKEDITAKISTSF